jgi:hypothetical protein
MYEFATPGPVTVAVKLIGGLLEITAEERDTATVEVRPWDDSNGAREAAEQVRVELAGDRLVIEAPQSGTRWLLGRSARVRVAARAPLDCPLEVKAASADIRCRGRFGQASVATASGDVVVEEVAGGLTANLTSGDLRVDRVAGDLEAHTASGDLTIGEVGGDVAATTASGDVRVRSGGGSVTARTASGDVAVESVHRGEVKVTSASGDVRIDVRRGMGVWLDLNTVSGSTTTELAMGDAPAETTGAQVTLLVRTVSGDIRVGRAELAPAS